MAQRTYLHVGTPKSGTAFVQAVLWQNLEALRSHGLLLPGRLIAHYAAARAVTEHRGAIPDHHAGTHDTGQDTDRHDESAAWARLARQVNRWPNTALISHALFAGASAEQADVALDRIDGEVHIVVTARALHLQPAVAWQEHVKGGGITTFDAFLQRLREDRPGGRRFWRVHDAADVAARWGQHLPPEHVHVVPASPLSPGRTAPQPARLWNAFATAVGLDPSAYDSDVEVTPSILGPAETELLRRVHARRDPRFTDPQRHVWTRQLLANDVLARRRATPLLIPDEVQPWLSYRTGKIVSQLRAAGYAVGGDLADLEWSDPPPDARAVSELDESEIDDLATWTILRLQERLVHREPVASPPPVGPEDGVDGILELLEHIRAADTGKPPRPAPVSDPSRVERIRRALPVLRSR